MIPVEKVGSLNFGQVKLNTEKIGISHFPGYIHHLSPRTGLVGPVSV